MENHVHVNRTKSEILKNSGTVVGGNHPKIGYDKATKRLRTIILRSSRLGLTEYDIADLPGARRLYKRRFTYQRFKIYVIIVVIIGALIAFALLSTTLRRKCFRIEDINLAT